MANVMNDTTNAQFIPTIIAQKALGRFASYMNLARTVSRDTDWTPATVGKVISVPKRGAVTASSKSAGSNVSVQNPTATNINVTLNNHYESTIAIDDVTAVLQNQDTMSGYADDMAIALVEQVEQSIAALHPSITNTVTWNRTSATTIDASMLAIRKFFSDQKVPKLEEKYGYFDSTVINDLLGVDKFTRYDALGQTANAIINGQSDAAIGQNSLKIYNVNCFETQNAPYTGSPGSFHNLVYTKNAFILASRPLPGVPGGFGAVSETVIDPDVQMGIRVVSSYDPNLLAMQLTIDVLWGISILDTRRVLEVEST